MLKIDLDCVERGHKNSMEFEGTVTSIAAEVCIAIGRIYDALVEKRKGREDLADEFLHSVITGIPVTLSLSKVKRDMKSTLEFLKNVKDKQTDDKQEEDFRDEFMRMLYGDGNEEEDEND